MQMNIIVDSPEEYEEWLAKQKTFHTALTASNQSSISNQIAQTK
jgi:heme/copper-type cytochrome/quinol oxidase subunit 2